ncbi:MAG: T9SS type B sorting domain-containing protein [Bacteroidetes bacterium]|nr:T9SS type B sorting domain-containing protein [Bacteroidota bacterium]
MKRCITLIWVALFIGLVGSLQKASASHLMGSDIIYRCLGNGKYEITVRVYRDCNGIPLSQSPIVVSCLSGGSTSFSVTNQTKVSVRDITGLDPNCPVQSRCSGTWTYGVEEHVFRATIDLSNYSCCEWSLSWSQSARNGGITTGQAGQNFYTYAVLNKCVTPCNSSPDFTNPPVAIICYNQDFVFNNGALDTIDVGDSLSYSFAPALTGPNTSATYNSPYSYLRPICFFGMPNAGLSSPGGIHLDPVTGDLSFRPTCQNQIAVVVIEVKEWRMVNGVMTVVGVTRRDMQIIVIPCPYNKVPKILPPYVTQACAGQQTCITIGTNDEDANDTVRISWNRGIRNATFTNNNGSVKHASGEVCWTPTENDISNIPYTFTITAKDNSCNPLPGQSVRAFSVFVRETPDADIFSKVLSCGKVAIDHTPKKNYAGYSFYYIIRDSLNHVAWSGNTKTDTAFLQPGWHTLYLNMKTTTPCFNVAIDSLFIPEFVQVDLGKDTFVCNGLPIELKSKTLHGNAPYSYEWIRMTDTGASGVLDTLPDYTVNNDSLETYALRILDGNGCRNYDTIQVGWFKRPEFNLGPDQRICNGSVVAITAQPDSTSTYSFLWSTGASSDAIDIRDSNTYWVIVTDSMGCWFSDSMNLFVNKINPDAGRDRRICKNDSVRLTASGNGSYSWYGKDGFTYLPLPAAISTDKDFFYRIDHSQGFILRVVQTYGGVTCTEFDSVQITMNELPEINLTAPPPVCLNGNPVSLAASIQFPTLYNGDWSNDATPLSVVNGVFYPEVAQVNTSPGHQVIYHVVDQNGCANEKAMYVKVNPLPVIELSDTIAVCGDIGIKELNDFKIKPGFGQTIQGIPDWYDLDNNPQVNGAIDKSNIHAQKIDIGGLTQNRTYNLVFSYTDKITQCSNLDTTWLRVKTVPVNSLSPIGPVCWNDPEVDLDQMAKPLAPQRVWSSPDLGLNSSNTFIPKAIGETFKYANPGAIAHFIYHVDEEGCVDEDSVEILIKGVPNLFLTSFDGWCDNAGEVNLMTHTNLQGGTWSGPGVRGNSFDPKIVGVGSGYILRYNFTDLTTSCSFSDSFETLVQAAPVVEMTTSDKACEGQPYEVEVHLTHAQSAEIKTTGDGEFDAKGSGLNSSTRLKTSYFPGTADNAVLGFSLYVTTTNNAFCSAASDNKQVAIFGLPSAEIEANPLKGCDPLEVNLKAITDAGNGVQYSWDLDRGNQRTGGDEVKDITETFTGAGIISIHLQVQTPASEGACIQDAEPVQVEILPTPVAEFTVNRWRTTVALPGIQFTDKSYVGNPAKIVEWTWDFGDRNASFSKEQNPFFEYPVTEPTDTGTYHVNLHVIADNGCEADKPGEIYIGPDITVFIPNAFTPDRLGEALNNRFYVIGEGFESFEIEIFNRWGELLYHSTDIKEGWDGNYKGQPAQQDVYMYVVKVISLNGKSFEYYGTITLLR